MLIDAHCHLNSIVVNTREEIISSCSHNNHCFIDSSIDIESSGNSLALSSKNDFIYSSLGFHPFCAEGFSDKTIPYYEELIDKNKKVVAIGEIGLDYKAKTQLDKQEEIFIQFIKLAKDKNLPIVMHNRLDDFRVIDILDKNLSTYSKVIFHCFSYSKDFLEKIVEKEGFISFSLNILRKNKVIIEALKSCPLSNLLLETDSPYMKIEGSSSTPLDVAKVYKFVAALREIDEDELEEVVSSNARRAFSL